MKLVIRADASPQIGTGHVMRCLALAQAHRQAGGEVIFAATSLTTALEARLKTEGMTVVRLSAVSGDGEDAAATVNLARTLEADWTIVDGYQFTADYQLYLKREGLKLLVLDDYGHATYYHADLVLNPLLGADPLLYQHREPYTRLLLGTDYVLLRQDFWPWRQHPRHIPPVAQRLLVTFGGADPSNLTLKVVQALQSLRSEALEALIVVGGSNPHAAALQEIIDRHPTGIRLMRDVTNMPELMAWAELAIAAGGTTCWELAFMGLPTVMLIQAENQRRNVETLADRGVVINLGWHEMVSPSTIAQAILDLRERSDQCQQMSDRGRRLVDGWGVQRVLAELRI